MRLGTVVNYDGKRKYIGKRMLKMQSETALRLLGNPAIVYDFKREDGHVVSVANSGLELVCYLQVLCQQQM